MSESPRITPCLWFDDQAEDAAEFYTAIFGNSKVTNISRYSEAGQDVHGKPAGDVMVAAFELEGQSFTALNGGPQFQFTPAISFFVSCQTKEEVDAIWAPLSAGGTALMPLQEYPFSERFGWVRDKYGVSWQVILISDGQVGKKIAPSLLFVGEQVGKAEEAMRFYTAIFEDSSVGDVVRYGEGEDPDRPGTVKHGAFTLSGQPFKVMDSNQGHAFTFNEAISFQVNCHSQDEIDRYRDHLTEGNDEQLQRGGWLKDTFGVSWQIVSRGMIAGP